MSRTLEILKAARELIAKRERWTKESFAKNEGGFEVDPHSQQAVCFCAVGALKKCADGDVGLAFDAHRAIRAKLPSPWLSIADFNDAHTHPEVLAVFDAAIASLSTPVEQEKRS